MKRMAIVVAVLFSGSCTFGAEWIRITKPLPAAGKAVQVGEEYEVRNVMGRGADKIYTIKARGRIVAVKAADVQLLDAQYAQLKTENRVLREQVKALKAKLDALAPDAGKDEKPEPGDQPQPKPQPEPLPERGDDMPKLNAPLTEEQRAVLAQQRSRLNQYQRRGETGNALFCRLWIAQILANYGHSEACLAELKRSMVGLAAPDRRMRSPLFDRVCECAASFRGKWKAPEVAAAMYRLLDHRPKLIPHGGLASVGRLWDGLAKETGNREHMRAAVKYYRAAVGKDATLKSTWERIRALEAQLAAPKDKPRE